jgi:hypothetical protein
MHASDPRPEPPASGPRSREPTSGRGHKRDSLFGEPIKKTWRPRPVAPPILGRIAACMIGALATITTCFAIAVARVLHVPIGGMLFLAAWLAMLAVGAYYGPSWWRREIQVVLTARHVIWRRGRLKRSIDRRQISYARIHWHRSVLGVGDLELVRAVPTGALRRTLSITFPDLEAPDAVWAEIRGVDLSDALGDGARPLGQRLDPSERLLWTEKPATNREWDVQRWGTLGVAVVAGLAGVRAVVGGVHGIHMVLQGGLQPTSAPFGALVLGVAISVAFVLGTAAIAGYHALFRPARLNHATRYLVTDRRVLIQRGSQELHLDRDRIVDVIDAPKEGGVHDLFLVVGGRGAHAHAVAGAFGEKIGARSELLPVLRAVHDGETVRALLAEQKAAA